MIGYDDDNEDDDDDAVTETIKNMLLLSEKN